MSNQEIILQQEISITLGGVTRTVTIKRLTEGHVWRAEGVPVVCRVGSGSKLHTARFPQVHQNASGWYFGTQSIRSGSHGRPLYFAEEVAGNSGWTNNATAAA